MNFKKIAITSLAALTAAVSVSSMTANANTLGESNLATPFEVAAGEGNSVTVVLDGRVGNTLTVTADVPADTLEEGKYYLYGELVADVDLEAYFMDRFDLPGYSVDYFDIVDLTFTTPQGDPVYPENVTLTFSTQKASAYNSVWIYEDGNYKLLAQDSLTTVVPHFSRFVIASIYREVSNQDSSEPEISPNSDAPQTSTAPSQTNTTPSQTSTAPSQPSNTTSKTGDSSSATAVVFAVMAVAALGTAVAASKVKKTSK